MAAFSSYFYYRYPKALCRDRGALGRGFRIPYHSISYSVFIHIYGLGASSVFRIPYLYIRIYTISGQDTLRLLDVPLVHGPRA